MVKNRYKDGKKHGPWSSHYFKTKSINYETTYKDGVVHGLYKSFYLDGGINYIGYFKNDIEVGYHCSYDEENLPCFSAYYIK